MTRDERECLLKVPMTEDDARAIANRNNARRYANDWLEHYRCSWEPRHWHVGHQHRDRMKSRTLDRVETSLVGLQADVDAFRVDFNAFRIENAAVLEHILATLQQRSMVFRWPWEPRP
jgi:hypothetical protein